MRWGPVLVGLALVGCGGGSGEPSGDRNCDTWTATDQSAVIRCAEQSSVVVAAMDPTCSVSPVDDDTATLECGTNGRVTIDAYDATCTLAGSCNGNATMECQGESATWNAGLSCDCVLDLTMGQHACARLASGKVRCWGFNYSGQLGLGHTNNIGDELGELGGYLPSVDLGTGRTAVTISSGPEGTCVVLDDATAKCWGDHRDGGGWEEPEQRGDEPGEMGDALPIIDLGTGFVPARIVQSSSTACAISTSGQVKCWGRNGLGQLGIGQIDADGWRGDGPGEMGDDLPEIVLGTNRTVSMLAMGAKHQCALLDDGSVKCWGENSASAHSPLGLGDTELRGDDLSEMGDALPAVDLGTGAKAVSVVAGGHHTCVLLEDNRVKCWGYNIAGQLGIGDRRDRGAQPGEMGDNLPAVDLGPKTVVELAAGGGHTCARFDDGSVVCWGVGVYGQLGNGDRGNVGDGCAGDVDNLDCSTPVDEMGAALIPVDLGTGKKARAIFAGPESTCALLLHGEIRCWGRNYAGAVRVPPQGIYSDDFIGDEPGEMGDNLPLLPLGLVCDASDYD